MSQEVVPGSLSTIQPASGGDPAVFFSPLSPVAVPLWADPRNQRDRRRSGAVAAVVESAGCPVRFLSDAQREQLSGFPAELEPVGDSG
jgi:hypothetical protein